MKTFKLKYKAISFLLLMAIIPSILGVHIFQHNCAGCKEGEIITRVITTAHSHDHACSACTCESACVSCATITGKHVHHESENSACDHQFKKASLEGQTQVVKYKFEAETMDLLHYSYIVAELSQCNTSTHILTNVIQKIPDEPSPENNCVFLL